MNRTAMGYELCNDTTFSFSNKTLSDTLGLPYFMCVTDDSYWEIGGDFYSERFQYVEIRLRKCVNSTANNNSCTTPDAIDAYLRDQLFTMIYINA
jgi:hypothetical protein